MLFSCNFHEIFKNTFLYGRPPVAASAQSSRNTNIKNEHVRIHVNAPLKIPSQVFKTKRFIYDELLINHDIMIVVIDFVLVFS